MEYGDAPIELETVAEKFNVTIVADACVAVTISAKPAIAP
jgi:hypothetical protein